MENTGESPGPTEQMSGGAPAEVIDKGEKKDTDAAAEPADNTEAEDGIKPDSTESSEPCEKDSAVVENNSTASEEKPATDKGTTNKSAEDADETLSVDHSADERDLLCQTAEERELQARDASLGSGCIDDDYVIIDELQGDDEEEDSVTTAAGSTTKEATEKPDKLPEAQGVSIKVEVDQDEEDTQSAQEAKEAMSTQEPTQDQAAEDYGSDDDVIIEEPPEKPRIIITMSDEEVSFSDPLKDKGNVATDGDTKASDPKNLNNVMEAEEGVDEDSVATESSGVEKGDKTLAEDADSEATQSSREGPVANGSSAGDSVGSKVQTAKKDAAECNGTSSLLKRPLSPDDSTGAEGEEPKKVKSEEKVKFEDGAGAKAGIVATAAEVMKGDKKFVVMSQSELEKYVSARVQESLTKQEQTMLLPMEKKCDTLHKALERWRKRSFQLQKQLNEFVCEQEKCAGARKGRVSQRSVGVCVRMPGMRIAASPTPAARTNVTSAVVSSTPAASPMSSQANRSGAGTAVTRSPMAPTVRVLTVPPPASVGATVLGRQPTQTSSAGGTGVPVPLQLIANTSSPTSQVKSVSLPVTTGSNTVVRTVTMVPTSTTVVTTSAGVKVIDLTQEEDGLAKIVADIKRSAASGASILSNKTTVTVSSSPGSSGTVQKITVPSSAIPVLSAAPTSLVQVSTVSGKNSTQVVGTGSTQTSTGTIRINSPVVAPQRVTYLLPNLTPNVVMNQREGAPRLATSTMSMPTILLRMATPPNNLVPGSTISMSSLTTQPGSGGNLMVAPGTQVRMIRAPTPVALQKGSNTFTLPPGTTVVRAPVTLSNAVNATVVTTKSDLGLPTQRVVVSGSMPHTLEVAKHPAPLPPMPRYLDDPKKKRLPPKPSLKITKAASGIVLSWNMALNSLYADIQTYQLYAYQETSNTPSSTQWKKVGDVRALPLPMACTLTQFVEGHKYHFAVRAVDIHNRLGPFSEPSSILLK